MDTPTSQQRPRVGLKQEAPAAYGAMAGFDRAIQLDPALGELVKIRASQLNGCAYCIDMHTRDARKAGESEQRLYALAAWRESPVFTPRERAALELTEAVTNIGEEGVPDAVYDDATAHFARTELANPILAINAWNRIAVCSHMVFAERAPRS